MLTVLYLIGTSICDLLFKSRQRLEAENLFLRHQLNIARRCAHIGFNYAEATGAAAVAVARIAAIAAA
jgi:hypothetical protein